jgi:hypothetical protein
MNPWSALLNGGMLAQGRGGGNDEGRNQNSRVLTGNRFREKSIVSSYKGVR